MDGKLVAYIGGGIAIAIGAAMLWFPPAQLAGQTATVGLGIGLIVTGLGALGVAATVPPAIQSARRAGAAQFDEERRSRLRRAATPQSSSTMTPAPPRSASDTGGEVVERRP